MSIQEDFETHPIGTAKEIKLSREVANQIEMLIKSYGEGIISYNLLKSFKELKTHYNWQMENRK